MRSNRRLSQPTRLLAFAVLALAALVAAPAAAQEGAVAPRTQYADTVRVNEVLLDVVVTDRRGNVVLGLDEGDFRVTEDGEPVEILDVTFYSNRRFLESDRRAEALGIDPAAIAADRFFILFFHDQRALLPRLGAQQLDAGRWAKKWVRGSLLPNDYVAVAGFDYQLELYQDFTRDVDEVTDAIDAAVVGRDVPRDEATRMIAGHASLAAHLPSEERLDETTPRVYEAIEVLAEAAAPIRGRKNLVLFSVGFGEANRFGLYIPDQRYYPDMVHALNDANAAVYTVDLIPSFDGGLYAGALDSSLSQLAGDTGGRYFFNFTNFMTPLEQVAADTNGYYLISYEVPEGNESGYQHVDVEVTEPGLRARAREGYVVGS